MIKLTYSPWGAIQEQRPITDDIISVSTASHGGLYVSFEFLEQMPEFMRSTPYSGGNWFEEDCDWSLVAVCFPEHFKPDVVKMAEKTLQYTYPETWKRFENHKATMKSLNRIRG